MISKIRYLAGILLLTITISAIVSGAGYYIPSSVIKEMDEISKTTEAKDPISFWGPYDPTLPWYDKAQDKAGFNIPWYNPAWEKAGWSLAENSCKLREVTKEAAKKGLERALGTFIIGEKLDIPDPCDVFNPEKMDKYHDWWEKFTTPSPGPNYRPYYTASLSSAIQGLTDPQAQSTGGYTTTSSSVKDDSLSTGSGTSLDSELGNLINTLKDKDAGVRLKAAEELGKLADVRAVNPLIYVLKIDENRDVRTKAAWALGQIDDPRSVDPLSYASVKDADGYVRGEAYKALQKNTAGGDKVDARSVDPIIGALKDKNDEVRYRAAEALGILKNATAVDPLIYVLKIDENRDVRTKAAWALGQIDDPRSVDPLSYASVKDADGYVRGEAYKALQKNTAGGDKVDARSVDPIIGALKDKNDEVRYRAAEALGILKDAAAVDPLIDVLKNDENRDVRTKAAWALGEIGNAQAVDPLNYAYVKDADGYVRGEAKNALTKLGQQVK